MTANDTPLGALIAERRRIDRRIADEHRPLGRMAPGERAAYDRLSARRAAINEAVVAALRKAGRPVRVLERVPGDWGVGEALVELRLTADRLSFVSCDPATGRPLAWRTSWGPCRGMLHDYGRDARS